MVMPASGGDAVPLFESPGIDFWTNWQALNPPRCDLSGASKQKSPKRCQRHDHMFRATRALRRRRA